MAKGYPSRQRARKAYWRGVKTAKTGRGMNPYQHPILHALFERGLTTTPNTPAPRSVYPAPRPRRAGSARLNRGARASDTPMARPIRYNERRPLF